jgi:hypothetical protein
VWTEPPTPDTLLAARLARGWRPIPSPLVTGPTVLGHARVVPPSDWAPDPRRVG